MRNKINIIILETTVADVFIEVRDIQLDIINEGEHLNQELYWFEVAEPGIYWGSKEWQEEGSTRVYGFICYDKKKNKFFERDGNSGVVYTSIEDPNSPNSPFFEVRFPESIDKILREYLKDTKIN